MSSIKKNFLYNMSYQLLTLILPLITTPYISRVMGAEKIGVFSYTYSIATYFGMFILLGLNNYGNRTIASVRDNKDKLSSTFWNIYAFQLVLGVVMSVIYLGYALFMAQEKIMALIQFFFLVSSMLDINWFYFGLEQFKLTVTRNTIIKVVTVIAIFIFVKSPDDLYKYTIIMALGTLGGQIVLWYFLKNYVQKAKITWGEIKKHIKPNLVLFVPVIAVSMYISMDKILLGYLTNKTEVGYFESANKVTTIPSLLIGALGTVMLPRVSNLVSKGKGDTIKRYLELSQLVSVFLSVSMALGMSGVVREFVPLFYGTGFEKCQILIPILVLSSIFIAWANVIRMQYLIPYKKDEIYVKSVVYGAIINIIVNIILIPKLASIGAAIGLLVSEATVCIYQSWRTRHELPERSLIIKSVPFVLSGIIMYLVIINIPIIQGTFITLVLKVILGAFIYLLLVGSYYLFYLKKNLTE